MAATSANPLLRFLRFLGSIQIAMVLLILWGAGMIRGTLVESAHSAEIARALVYDSWWFDLTQILIGVNLVMAVVNRLPLKRHQYSFAVVHAGFVMFMIGGLTTSTIGYEGELYVEEGKSSNSLVLHERKLSISGGGAEEELQVPKRMNLDGYSLRAEGGGKPSIEIMEYVPTGTLATALKPGFSGDPAGVAIAVYPQHGVDDDHGHGPEFEGFLLEGAAGQDRHDLNIFEVSLERVDDEQAFIERAKAMAAISGGYQVHIERGLGFPATVIELPEQLNEDIDLGDGLRAKVTDFAERAMVGGGGIQDVADGRLNPAAILILSKGEIEERHTLFSMHPEFAAVRGAGDEPLASKVQLNAPVSSGGRLAFRYLISPSGDLALQIEGPDGRQAAMPVEAGKRVTVPGYAYAVAAERFLPEARLGAEVTRLDAGADGGKPLLQLKARYEGAEELLWMAFGQSKSLRMKDQVWSLRYSRDTMALPFAVALQDFQIEYHPGSRRESEYASEVQVASLDGSVEQIDTTISMNRTLDYMGYRLFQSSYFLGRNGGPDTTILSVNHDPGAPIVYWSFGILIFGIGWYVLGDGRKKRNSEKNGGRSAASAMPPVPPAVAHGEPVERKAENLETVS